MILMMKLLMLWSVSLPRGAIGLSDYFIRMCKSSGHKLKRLELPTLYWLPKLHQRPYTPCFIANSSSCTTP